MIILGNKFLENSYSERQMLTPAILELKPNNYDFAMRAKAAMTGLEGESLAVSHQSRSLHTTGRYPKRTFRDRAKGVFPGKESSYFL